MTDKDKPIIRCPDGSWSKFQSRRCKLEMGHTGPHQYEIKNYDRKS